MGERCIYFITIENVQKEFEDNLCFEYDKNNPSLKHN